MNRNRRLAWTLGWRLASRSRLRTLLVCLAIALPVAVGTAVAAVTATARVSTPEAEAAAFGAADGRLTTLSGERNPDATAPARLAEQLKPSLPDGTRLAYDIDVLGLTVRGPEGRQSTVDGRAVDLADPLTDGLYRVDQGAPSVQDGTIVLSSALADAVGITEPGQRVFTGGGQFTVSALVSDRFDLGHRLFALPPGGPMARTALASAKDLGSPRWFVTWPPRADLPTASGKLSGELKSAGYAYVPSSQAAGLSEQGEAMDSTALLVGLGLLAETVLLVTAAFAVVVRSQRRHMGLLAALGAPARVTASFLRTHALCVAVIGSSAGVVAGQVVARVAAPVLAERAGADWGTVDGAWTTSLVLAAVAVAVTVLASVLPSRAALREEPTALLKAVPPVHSTRQLRLRNAATGCLVAATVAGLAAVVVDAGALTAVLGVVVFAAGITASALVLSSLAARKANTSYLPLPTVLRSALRSLLAFPVRAITTVIALGVVAAVSTTVLIASASVAHKQREDHLPELPDTSALIVSSRPLTATERGALRSATGASEVSTGYQRAAIARDGKQLPVSPRTDFLDCIDDRGLLAYGNNDWQPCYVASRSHIPFPAVGIADTEGAEALAGAMTDEQRRRYESGQAAVAVTPVGLTGEVSLVAMGRKPDGFVLENTATLPLIHPSAARETEYQQLPAVLVSQAGARKAGIIPVGSPTYLLDAGSKPAQQDVLRALPVDAQADSTVAVESGPSVVGAVARLQPAVAGISVLTTMLIVAAMVSLWNSDLGGEYRMLGAVGATAWWRRRLASSLSGLLIVVSCVAGTLWGMAASVAFLTGMDTDVAVPAGWLAGTVVAAVITAAVMGGALVPRRARAQRQA
ncbi:FtsX-like permease family protein [Streptomyces bambusae]|uniref:FtsX-like permease family protein n=1 Tax=Streptomyces bambusae TaxID=1550616 RepID=A0ABS6Z1P3_9ACTN|nr:FtsX-like permease family protein [Streptomyces bambusae]MBW5481662.1 FtsX-like permease family protein [Streptomyces bambusae]